MSAGLDQRTDPRRRVVKGTKIAYGDFVFVQDCTVRDLSASGARIAVTAAMELPEEFFLVFTTDRIMRKSRVKWRKAAEVGVIFEGEPHNYMADNDPRFRQFKQS
jgi:PilZ domain